MAGYFAANPYSMNVLYPFKVLSVKGLHSLDFSEITILYGGNGSGKSTALNAISNKLGLARNSVYNKGDMQHAYLSMCDYELAESNEEEENEDDELELKDKAALITSDDIFKYMLDTRKNNAVMKRKIEKAADEWYVRRNKNGKVSIMDIRLTSEQRAKLGLGRIQGLNRSQYVRITAGERTNTYSNGETGFMKFVESIVPNRLYILDEPEAALSPMRLLTLIGEINYLVKNNSQLIIATHSPILMAFPEADILEFSEKGIKKVDYKETEHYQVTKSFLDNPEKMLRHLLD